MTLDYFALLLASGPEAVKLPLAMLVVFGSARILDELFERVLPNGEYEIIRAGELRYPTPRFDRLLDHGADCHRTVRLGCLGTIEGPSVSGLIHSDESVVNVLPSKGP